MPICRLGHLSRQFRLAYGEPPYAYLMTRRIERAMALLRRGDLSVTEVCFAVGYGSLGTFSTRFTELVGVPPSTYRRRAAVGVAAEMPSCISKRDQTDQEQRSDGADPPVAWPRAGTTGHATCHRERLASAHDTAHGASRLSGAK